PLQGAVARTIARRALLALSAGDIVNLGVGMPTKLPAIALEEGVLDRYVFTNEHGVFGGLMASALGGSFVPALNADAIMDSAFQFGFYEGGGLDIAFLGMGQADAKGNVNVTRFGQEWNGPGGFCSIVENTPRLVFCGSFTAVGLKAELRDGSLHIAAEGKTHKFVREVEQVTFNARRAHERGQQVLYITERAVFALDADGLVLTELAPGVDIDRDIRPHMGFPVRIAEPLRRMDARITADGPMGLAADLG